MSGLLDLGVNVGPSVNVGTGKTAIYTESTHKRGHTGLLDLGVNLGLDKSINTNVDKTIGIGGGSNLGHNKKGGLLDLGVNVGPSVNVGTGKTAIYTESTHKRGHTGLLDLGVNLGLDKSINTNVDKTIGIGGGSNLGHNKKGGLLDLGVNVGPSVNVGTGKTAIYTESTHKRGYAELLDLRNNKNGGLLDLGVNVGAAANVNTQKLVNYERSRLNHGHIGLVNLGVNLKTDKSINSNVDKKIIDINGISNLSHDKKGNFLDLGVNVGPSANVDTQKTVNFKGSNLNRGQIGLVDLGANLRTDKSLNTNVDKTIGIGGGSNLGHNKKGGLLDLGVTVAPSANVGTGKTAIYTESTHKRGHTGLLDLAVNLGSVKSIDLDSKKNVGFAGVKIPSHCGKDGLQSVGVNIDLDAQVGVSL
ncbi:uncharacterized protein LOC111644058 [Copidosoma floridanum]|uniref:uncharacterized protein LOC111644058 n=1 Tax=Copidosoma floridanum TaxID=29053 RepID=UPI000C6F90AB|nr:uncharacterized protein LOC111644058 [Copidosoma floridanum]